MILLCGIPSESPLAMVSRALNDLGAPCIVFNQRQFASTLVRFQLAAGPLTGWLELEGQGYPLSAITGVYTRLMDHHMLPEVQGLPADATLCRQNDAVHNVLAHWCEITPARVVNRVAAMGSNSSKPYQAQLISRHGFAVPETLITNDPELVLAFNQRHRRIIYKSISGARSIVQTFEDRDRERLESLRWCPTQFQEYIAGTDVRVHVVDEAVFATAVKSQATDYRYAQKQVGAPAELEAFPLPGEVAAKCVRLARALGLVFAGIDLKFTPDQRVYCFEVNPCPGFSYYEANTGQPIAQAVARYLVG